MKTKVTLTINDVEYTLDPDCLANWDEVVCNYKRSDFGGVVRSFSSKFEFAGTARDMLLDLFLRDEVKSSASVAIWLIDDDWVYNKEFECALDFSTASWTRTKFSISCLDTGMAALIKSRKSTKYELTLGEDVPVTDKLQYDRVIMQNTCTYELMGDSNDDGSVMLEYHSYSGDPYPSLVYTISDEVFENSALVIQDQDGDDDSFFLKAENDISDLNLRIEVWSNWTPYRTYTMDSNTSRYDILFHLLDMSDNDTSEINADTLWMRGPKQDRTFIGTFPSYEALVAFSPNPAQNVYAFISDEDNNVVACYYTPVSNNPDLVKWEQGELVVWATDNSVHTYSHKVIFDFNISLEAGHRLQLKHEMDSLVLGGIAYPRDCPIFSKITANWESRAKTIEIDAVKPENLAKTVLNRVCDGRYNVITHFSDYDPRLAKTYLLAAESIRGMEEAKIYSSFNDFCDWMETVYGYVYTLGDVQKSRFRGLQEFISISNSTLNAVKDYPDESHSLGGIAYDATAKCFAIFDQTDSKYYRFWVGCELYTDNNGTPRTDMLFKSVTGQYRYFSNGTMQTFTGDPDEASKPTQDIYFQHRSEIFVDEPQGITFGTPKDVDSKVDKQLIYSEVEIGYEKQNYETQCGRDEWNFRNYYNTGIDIVEKKLSLMSKYRADCYGLEFLAQERAKDNTDNRSDNTIFFVYCKQSTSQSEDTRSEDAGDTITITKTSLMIDRSISIAGALSDSVFNGEFSPYYCLKANEGYISAMAKTVTLQFASSDGNSDIVIDGMPTTGNVTLSGRLFNDVELSFTSPYLEGPFDTTKAFSVVYDDMTYTGFLKEAQVCYARPEETEYTLIVKSMDRDDY